MSGIHGLYRVKLGETIKSPSINRSDVADGTRGRALLLTADWLGATVAYSQEPYPRGVFYVTEEEVIKYSLQPRVYYIALIARLNTDARGNILDDSFKIEYVRLGEQQYEEYANRAMELNKVETVVLTKVTKGNFSYVKIDPSQVEQDSDVMKSIASRLKGIDVDSCLKLVVQDVARPFSIFEQLLAKSPIAGEGLPSLSTPKPKVINKPKPAQELPPPEVEKAFDNNFEFGSDDDDDEW